MWKTLRDLIEQRGIGGRVIVSAELGLNHGGHPGRLEALIAAAAEAGCQAVKVQNYRTGDVVRSRGETIRIGRRRWNAWDLFAACELDRAMLARAQRQAARRGLVFHATPTGSTGVLDLEALGCRILKLASDTLVDAAVLEPAAKSSCCLIASLGCVSDAGLAAGLAGWRALRPPDEIVWLHCMRRYPTPYRQAEVERLGRLRDRLGPEALVGYSDHTRGITCALRAVRDHGACWIEKHFTLDKGLDGPDHAWSADPGEMAELTAALKKL